MDPAARQAGKRVEALLIDDAEEAMGINDQIQLAESGGIMRQRINDAHQRAGVSLIDPVATYIDADVTIGAGTVIHPGVHLRGRTKIGSGCEIEPGAVVTDCSIGDRVHIKPGSVLSESSVGNDCAIGPMAHLRPVKTSMSAVARLPATMMVSTSTKPPSETMCSSAATCSLLRR